MLEVIRLDRRPLSGHFCLSVNGIAPATNPTKLERCLREGGLLENLVIHRAPDRQWATAQYFCEADCEAVRQQCDGMVLDGRRINVARAGKLSSVRGILPISASKAIDLMNHYVGFNRWSSEVVSLRRRDAANVGGGDSEGGVGRRSGDNAFSACVRVMAGGVIVEGVGDSDGVSEGYDEGVAFAAADGQPSMVPLVACARCKKAAVTNALKAALGHLAIIRLPDGRVLVKVVESETGRQGGPSHAPAGAVGATTGSATLPPPAARPALVVD